MAFMRRPTRRFLSILLVFLAALPAAFGATTLRVVVWDLKQTAYIEAIARAYCQSHPSVKIDFFSITSSDYSQNLAVLLAGGDRCDLVAIKDMPSYVGLVAKGKLAPLEERMAASRVDPALYDGLVDQLAVKRRVYALPYRYDSWLLFYNKDLFDAAGLAYPGNDLDWDAFAGLARRLSRGRGDDRIYGAHFHVWRSAVQLAAFQDGRHDAFSGDYRFMKPYYEMALDLQDGGAAMDFAVLKDSRLHYSVPFYQGRVAMLPMGSWFVGSMIAAEREKLSAVRWGIARYPHPKGVPAGTTAAAITALALNAKSAHIDEAWDFLRFWCGPEGAMIMARAGAYPAIRSPAVVDALASLPGFPRDAGSRQALANATLRLELPPHPKAAAVDKILNEYHDLIMSRGIGLDAGLDQMSKSVQAALKAP